MPAVKSTRARILAVVLLGLLPRFVRAEDALSTAFESWQEDGGRIHVSTEEAFLEKDLTPDTKLKAMGVVDVIAGATPTGLPPATTGGQVPLATMHDRRNAGTLDVIHQFEGLNLDAGYSRSVESDYVSNGLSLNSLFDFNGKNTTLLLGLAGTSDNEKVFFQPQRATRRGRSIILGLTQVVDKNTSLTLDLTFSRETGYLGDPYRLIEQGGLAFLENRPAERNQFIAFAGLNHAWPEWNGAVDASYRCYRDTYGISSHTLEVSWLQKFAADRVMLQLGLRGMHQTAADFYHVDLNGTGIVPGALPDPDGPFFSSDYRLSRMETLNLRVKLVWTVEPRRFFLDAGFARYLMRGLDHTTSSSAYADANLFSVGAKLCF
ncbi:MAG: DUF3570 domain-containing protein [Verrucomicrobiota bacterium]